MALCAHAVELTGVAGNPESPVHRLDPRAKVVGFVGITLVAVSTPLAAWPVWVACVLVLAALAWTAGVGPGTVWRRTRIVVPLVVFAALFLPFVRGGATVALGPLHLSTAGLETLASVTAKAGIGVTSAVLLGATTTFPAVLNALESLRVPRLFVLIAAFTYRYLFVILEEVGRMRAALAARAYRPRHLLHVGPLGRVATALFLRTYARGERVYLAMLARGYDGAMPRLDALRLTRADAVFLVAVGGTLLPLRLALGLA
jgi:cobalt/nickel transport system permease protein